MDIKQQSECLVVNPIEAYTYGFLVNRKGWVGPQD